MDNPGRPAFEWPNHPRVGALSAPAWVLEVWAANTVETRRLRDAYVYAMEKALLIGSNAGVPIQNADVMYGGDPDAAYEQAQYEAWIEARASQPDETVLP